MDGRREIRLAGFDEVMPEVMALLEGCETVGNWSLAQILNHLAGSMRMSVDGIDLRAPWIVRKLVAPLVLRQVFRTGAIRPGIKLTEPFLPRPGLDARAEAEALREALAYYEKATGPRADHPFFGRLSRADWDRLHLIHIAHHLGFARPAVAVG